MAIFVVLWYYLLTNKLSCLQKNNFGHTKRQGLVKVLTLFLKVSSDPEKKSSPALPLLFLNNNDPAFCALLFATHFLDPLFKVPNPKKILRGPES